MGRTAKIDRETTETQIAVQIDIDGSGESNIDSGIGFFDHMLTHVARHGLIDLTLKAHGDTYVDYHHTVEDIGIVFGQALQKAAGDKKGIERFASVYIAMDESLVHIALDFSGRPHLEWCIALPKAKVGEFDTELVQEFFRAVVYNAGITLHIRLIHGSNLHHIIEAVYKAFGRGLRDALTLNPRVTGVPSTKGSL